MEKVNEFYQKAMEARASKNIDESVKHLQKALKRLGEFMKEDPKNPAYPLKRAHIYSSIKAYKYAEKDLLLAIRCDKKNARPLFLLGNFYLETKDFEMAIEAYDKFFVLDKRQPSEQAHAEVYFNRSIAKNGLEWYDEALEDLDLVAELDQEYPKLDHSRQTIQNNKLMERINEYTGIIGFKPRDWRTLFKRAAIFEQITDYSSAIKDYKAIMNIQPKNMEALVKLGVAYHNNGQYQLSLDILEEAKKRDTFYEREIVTEYMSLAKGALDKS
ncbi:MAG: tetratricopeptide repeat protein [Saprospiraceae bacterium]|nr:tetratricopeptide repeat protein [Saprospiraceae bacterium]